jgi:hypothetical protein
MHFFLHTAFSMKRALLHSKHHQNTVAQVELDYETFCALETVLDIPAQKLRSL